MASFDNFISKLFATIIILMVLVLTLCEVHPQWGEEKVLFLKFLLPLATAAMVVSLRKNYIFRVHWLDGAVLLWMLYATANYLLYSSAPSGLSYYHLLTTAMLYAVLRLCMGNEVRQMQRWVILGIAGTGLFEAVLGGMQLAGLSASRHYGCGLTGTFYNSGPYGGYLLVALAVVTAYCYRRYPLYTSLRLFPWRGKAAFTAPVCYLFCLVSGGILLMVLPATWSRAAWVGYGAVVGLLLYRRHRKGVLWGLLAAGVAGVGLYFAKQGSADGRVLMAWVALLSVVRSPLLGHGVGGFASAFAEEQAAFFSSHPTSGLVTVAGSPDHAFNELLHIGVEQGMVGMLFFAVIAVGSCLLLLRHRSELAYGWIALLVFALFSYPFTQLPFRVSAVLFVAMAAGYAPKQASLKRHTLVKMATGTAVAGLALWLLPTVTTKVEESKAYARIGGSTDLAFLDDYAEWHEVLADHPAYLFHYGKMLNEAGRYNDSNAVLREGMAVSTDPMFRVVMGNNYKALGAYTEAEACYTKAYHMVPNRMYPLYQLLQLYIATGKDAQATATAQQITDFVPKIHSAATEEMKEFASGYLKNKEVIKQ